jgi:uncharacterized surface protein with fasciclin (FAS1) repeats
VDIALSNPGFEILTTLLQRFGLVEPLQSDGPFTVLAPTDDAFCFFFSGIRDACSVDDVFEELEVSAIFLGNELQNRILTRILLLHVIPDFILKDDIEDGAIVDTLFEQTIRFEVDGSDIRVFDQLQIEPATVTLADLLADNGVVHVIDNVIVPDIDFSEDFNDFCDPDALNFDTMSPLCFIIYDCVDVPGEVCTNEGLENEAYCCDVYGPPLCIVGCN